ncbi:hypothetical protein NE686_03985 [Tissierella carlieri]|uniref:Uncharacterized protein n=1 Tax=Tissierella carlieri TaxID=689904 RepID=A0ABT1S6Z6_9FIRM|nr:hypothetical protein [Tissierella carlieri]MCQ4922231.1 hypothetical protein [Tissierella carlieri]
MRKMSINGNDYNINSRRLFNNTINVEPQFVDICFDFAYDMTFGRTGEHRSYRSGGQNKRKNGEIFINTFQGKIAEYSIYQYFVSSGIQVPQPDIRTFDLGTWDSCDFLINGYRIAVKSTKHFGNLMLLETKDWNEQGEYVPNVGSMDAIYDYFVLVRISPDGESIMKKNRLLYCNSIDRESLYKTIVSDNEWKFDIPGFINRNDLIHAINNKYIIPQNAMLNGKTKMDAENYYIQAGDMYNIENLLLELR